MNKKWDNIFYPSKTLKEAKKELSDLEGITFEIRLIRSYCAREIKYTIVYDAADVKIVKFKEPDIMEVTLADDSVHRYEDCSYCMKYDYEYFYKIHNAEELKKEATKLGYNIIKKKERIKLLPCICGCNKRTHWYKIQYYGLRCTKCGLEAAVRSEESESELKKEWNHKVTLLSLSSKEEENNNKG